MDKLPNNTMIDLKRAKLKRAEKSGFINDSKDEILAKLKAKNKGNT